MENLATFKVTPSAYQHAMTPSWERSENYQMNMGSSASYGEAISFFDAGARKASGKLFTVRTSKKTIDSYSSSVFSSSVLSAAGNGSFVKMHNDVSTALDLSVASLSVSTMSTKPGGKPTDPAIGETNPDVPVGDAVLPMLLIACAYVVVRWFRNRKLNKIVNSQNV